MPKLPCRCGYVHNLSAIPDDGFQVLPDWATDKVLYACLGWAVDETEAVVPDAWVARPLDEDTTARLRAQGA